MTQKRRYEELSMLIEKFSVIDVMAPSTQGADEVPGDNSEWPW